MARRGCSCTPKKTTTKKPHITVPAHVKKAAAAAPHTKKHAPKKTAGTPHPCYCAGGKNVTAAQLRRIARG